MLLNAYSVCQIPSVSNIKNVFTYHKYVLFTLFYYKYFYLFIYFIILFIFIYYKYVFPKFVLVNSFVEKGEMMIWKSVGLPFFGIHLLIFVLVPVEVQH